MTAILKGLPINKGLVGYWPLGNLGTVRGNVAVDLSGRRNNGALVGSPPLVPGIKGQALSFNGSSQNVSVPYAPALWSPAISVFCWVFPTAFTNSYATMISHSNYDILAISGTSGKLSVYLTTSGGTQSYDGSGNFTLPLNTWSYVGYTYNSAGGLVGYVNGAVDAAGGSAGTLTDAGGSIAFGYEIGNARNFTGYICGVRFYTRALTPIEARTLYKNGRNPNFGLIGSQPRRANVAGGGSTAYFQTCLATNSAVSTLIRSDNKILLASNTSSAGIIRAIAAIKLATDAPLAFLARQTAKTAMSSDAPVALLTRSTGKTVSAQNAAVGLLISVKALLRTISASNTPSASLARTVGKSALAVNSTASMLSRLTAKTLAGSNAAASSLTRLIGKTNFASNAAVALATAVKAALRTFVASNAAVSTLARSVGKNSLAANSAAATLGRMITKPLAANNSALARLVRATARNILATNAAAGSLARSMPKTVTASNEPVASLQASRGKTLTATVTALANLISAFSLGSVVAAFGAARSVLRNMIQKGLRPMAGTLSYRTTSLLNARAPEGAIVGATSLTLGTLPAGLTRIAIGDQFAGGLYTFTGAVAATAGTITAAPFTPALVTPLTAGAPVAVMRNNDIDCLGWVEWLDSSTETAPNVKQGDARITILADTLLLLGVPFQPKDNAKIVENGKVWNIENVGRDPVGAGWVLQVKE